MFALQEEASAFSQGSDMSIAKYFTKMKALWDEIDNLSPTPTCTCNVTQKFYTLQQNFRLIQFLMKWDPKYSQIRSNILMMPQLPSLNQPYRILNQEQKHQELNKLTSDFHNSSSALVTHKLGSKENRTYGRGYQQ